MSFNTMQYEVIGRDIRLTRDQWQGHNAYISNYPGLLDEVQKYTWTYSDNGHPYLRCSRLNISLHQFVLSYLYGNERLGQMLSEDNIIEHLDNNGLNCSYDNLHILSSDLNKAKAFTIDKANTEYNRSELMIIPSLISDVYYSHKKSYFQMQIYFNKNPLRNKKTGAIVDTLILQYGEFNNLFIDWLYALECRKKEEVFYLDKHHAQKVYCRNAPMLELSEEEKKGSLIIREGVPYIIIRTEDDGNGLSFMTHTAFIDID